MYEEIPGDDYTEVPLESQGQLYHYETFESNAFISGWLEGRMSLKAYLNFKNTLWFSLPTVEGHGSRLSPGEILPQLFV